MTSFMCSCSDQLIILRCETLIHLILLPVAYDGWVVNVNAEEVQSYEAEALQELCATTIVILYQPYGHENIFSNQSCFYLNDQVKTDVPRVY